MSAPVQPWYKRAIAAWVFGASTAGYLFIVTLVPFVGLLYGRGVQSLPSYSFACFPLAAGGMALSVLTFLVPALVSGTKLQFPLNFTLPAVYCGLIFVSSQFMGDIRPSIALLGESSRLDQVWSRPDFLVSAFLVQVVCLTFSMYFSSRINEAQP